MDARMDHSPAGQDMEAHVATGNTPRHMSMTMASATSSPLSSAPPTPGLPAPCQPALPATSPLPQHVDPPKQPFLRRTSSALSLGARSTSSPKLVRKGSRQSLQAEEAEKRPTPKRSISNLIANLREAQGTMESIEEPVQLTAAQIAMEHFVRELVALGDPSATAETVVILHDACYGHRYSRLKTTKSTLSMIVERPERLHASVLGASAAYVRLGQHHAGAKNAPHPGRGSGTAPPFKIRRTARSVDITSSYVTNVHGTAWMSELRTLCNAAGDRLAAGTKELSRSSTPTDPEKRKLHEGDLYLAPESLDAFQGALGGVADAIDAIFEPQTPTKRSFVAIRPPGHHCSADHPSGFCWLNNVHVGIEYATQTYGLTHAAILDFDLHHGDGSQAITWERNSRNNQKRLNAKPNSKLKLGADIGYYSIHDINSYPCEMGDDEKVQAAGLCIENAHGQSIWNVHLQPWRSEDEFWELYETRYKVLLDKARVFLRHHAARLRAEGNVQPRSAIFISAGFDASEWESAGMQRHKVNVPTEFYARFTRDVVQLAEEEGSGCDGRIVSVLEGGYSDRALCSGILSHLSGLCATPVVDAIKKETKATMPLDAIMNGLRINGTSQKLHYDKSWWSEANLTALELKVNPPLQQQQGKRVRTGPQPTYATPTESFAYKVVDPNKFARSISGTMRDVPMPQRPRTPPPPGVDWVLATQELSKLLIPIDRQTLSCTAEELGGVRSKKERQSAMPVLTTVEDAVKPRQLRDRKVIKLPAAYAESAHSDEFESLRSMSRSSNGYGGNRRQTMHELPTNTTDEQTAISSEHVFLRRASRRLSAGSAFGSLDGMMDAEAPPVPALPTVRPPLSTTNTNGYMRPPAVPTPAAGNGIQLKKTRAPVSKPRKAAAVAGNTPAPAGVANDLSATQQAPAAKNMLVPMIAAASAQLTSVNDVDQLASGMKKISLKVGSREDSERKAKERDAAERRARALKGAETRRVNAAAKKAATQNGIGGVPVSQPTTKSSRMREAGAGSGPMVQSAIEQKPAFVAIEREAAGGAHEEVESSMPGMAEQSGADIPPQPPLVEHEVKMPASLGPRGGSTAESEPPTGNDGFQFEAPTQSTGVELQLALPHIAADVSPSMEPTVYLEAKQQPPPAIVGPNSAARQLIQEDSLANGLVPEQATSSSPLPTVSSPPGQINPLPIFTSTDRIPFAPTAPMSPTSKTKTTNSAARNTPPPNSPLWRQGLNGMGGGADIRNISGPGNGVSRTMHEIPVEEEITQGPTPGEEMDIWEVPETPTRPLLKGK